MNARQSFTFKSHVLSISLKYVMCTHTHTHIFRRTHINMYEQKTFVGTRKRIIAGKSTSKCAGSLVSCVWCGSYVETQLYTNYARFRALPRQQRNTRGGVIKHFQTLVCPLPVLDAPILFLWHMRAYMYVYWCCKSQERRVAC